MKRQPIPLAQWATEVWSCSWCHANTSLGGEHFEIARPPCEKIEHRWDRAYSFELFDEVDHAYVGRHQTLCGLTHPDITLPTANCRCKIRT